MFPYKAKKELLRKEFLRNKSGVRLQKNNSNLFRQRKDKLQKINVKDFTKIIYIDRKNGVAEVEGMITFEDFVKETLKFGFLPAVVPQLKTITVGGAISGVGIEASSFRYGLVHETILEMEILLSDGRIVVCTPNNKYKDLFFGIPNSYGSLGYILKVKLKLVPSREFVKINHVHYKNARKYFEDLDKICENGSYDFVDGVIFSKEDMYITTGRFVDEVPHTSNYKYMNIYYKSIKKNKNDYLTTSDFIWRWDTDWFWCSKLFYMQNPIIRFLFGKFALNSKAYWKIKGIAGKYFKENIKKESVVQDVAIPIENCVKFLDFFNKEVKISPIWICPIRSYKKNRCPLFDVKPFKLYVDFGFWDIIKTNKPKGHYNKRIEEIVEKLKGHKSLYSKSFYKENKFWELYNGKAYWKLKKKYDKVSRFKDLYEKCVKNS